MTEQRSKNLQVTENDFKRWKIEHFKVQIIEMNNLKLLFSTLQEMKKDELLVDYRISQTTLDDVFISFAKRQGTIENKEENIQIVISSSKTNETNF